MLVHVNEQNLYNSAVSKNCQGPFIIQWDQNWGQQCQCTQCELSGADCDGSDGDKLGGLLVNKVHVMHT